MPIMAWKIRRKDDEAVEGSGICRFRIQGVFRVEWLRILLSNPLIMNARAFPTALSFGQFFLLEEMNSRASTARRKKTRHSKIAYHQPNFVRLALLGWLMGVTVAIIFRCIWG